MKRGMWLTGAILALGVVALILVLRQGDFSIEGGSKRVMTSKQEIALGARVAPRLSEALGGLDLNPETQGMATTVGERIAGTKTARQSPYRFQFHVLADTALAEAYAVPGGSIFLTRGLLDRLENEGQLAGVLAHQVSHVLARHAAARFTPRERTQAAIDSMFQLRYGGEEETEADTLAVRLLGEAGFDPRALLDLLRVAEEATRLSGGRGFSTRHPLDENRRTIIQETIARSYPTGIPSTLTLGRWFAPEPPGSPEDVEDLDTADSMSVGN